MVFSEKDFPAVSDPLFEDITHAYRMDETKHLETLLANIDFSPTELRNIESTARLLVMNVREQRIGKGGFDAFLYQYDLSSEEGIALMCLAEALLRIPDAETADRLIRDKITASDWETHLGQSDSFFVNAATWGLLLTGKILSPQQASRGAKQAFKKLVKRSGEPVIRNAVKHAMKILGRQFVMGRNIEEALERAKKSEARGYRYSYDMLGEAARTAKDAQRYFDAYQQAIIAIAEASGNKGYIAGPGISIKLSALHPRYEFAKRERVFNELVPKFRELALQAKVANIGLTVDAEESERLELSLEIIEKVFSDKTLEGWEGFGLAVQSYQKRAWYVIDWLINLARKHKRKIMLRLIKGAYWDTEIKASQVFGYEGYPVFTRKNSTDVSFLACAKKILTAPDAIYPQFATHNAHTVATVLEMAKGRTDFEFQCLHGMGQTLYDQIVGSQNFNLPCRMYAPVGGHEDLLAYLVRRLLENGANTSFVNRIIDEKAPVEEIIANPVDRIRLLMSKPHPYIPLPIDLYGKDRKNSRGVDLTNMNQLKELKNALDEVGHKTWRAMPIINGKEMEGEEVKLVSPINSNDVIGAVVRTSAEQTDLAIEVAVNASRMWDKTSVDLRAAALEKAANLFETHRADLISLLVREGGKTLGDAVSEVREAIDFCRYYAMRARRDFAVQTLPGPTGESNQLELHGRGVVACISPWNFPLAIFIGQVVAALVTGNCVIAKPAKQTPLVAALAINLLYAAGIPKDVLQFLPGSGAAIGPRLIADDRVNAIVMTGSTETAQSINQGLAARSGAIPALIAETGGQNVMIVDSSALPEQVVADVCVSAFNSAGQRCSALRVLYVQEDIADKLIEMLKGAMAELSVGNPSMLNVDIGPVIDNEAKEGLEAHVKKMEKEGKLIYRISLPQNLLNGSYFAPCAFEINSIKQLEREVFGPILHVIRYKTQDLDNILADINKTGYGLTMGIHSRINETVQYIKQRLHVGNFYVNRNMIGAVVGVQPFGGEGLSGTGPKAGGPYYLPRFCVERTVCVNTTAAGGNATLMSLQEE